MARITGNTPATGRVQPDKGNNPVRVTSQIAQGNLAYNYGDGDYCNHSEVDEITYGDDNGA